MKLAEELNEVYKTSLCDEKIIERIVATLKRDIAKGIDISDAWEEFSLEERDSIHEAQIARIEDYFQKEGVYTVGSKLTKFKQFRTPISMEGSKTKLHPLAVYFIGVGLLFLAALIVILNYAK